MLIRSLMLALILVGGASYLIFVDAQPPPTTPPPGPDATSTASPIRVRATPVVAAPDALTLTYSGMLRARDDAALAFTLGGRITERPVDIGDTLHAGDVVARIDPKPLQHNIRAANAALRELNASLNQARRDRDRAKQLFDANAATLEEVEQQSARVDTLRASRQRLRTQRDEAKRLLTEGTLLAPFDGIVTRTLLDVGEFAGPGQPVLALSGPGLELELEIPERFIRHLHPGDPVTLAFPLAELPSRDATLRSVTRSVPERGRFFPIVIDVPPTPDLRPGLTAQVTLRIPQPKALAVPVAAVINPRRQQPQLFRIDDGHARRVAVEIRALSDNHLWVDAPLDPGDLVIVTGQSRLRDGQPVEILP